jgi:hypothetical protein
MWVHSNNTFDSVANDDNNSAEHHMDDWEHEDLGPYFDDDWQDNDDFDDSDNKIFGIYHL